MVNIKGKIHFMKGPAVDAEEIGQDTHGLMYKKLGSDIVRFTPYTNVAGVVYERADFTKDDNPAEQ